VRGRSLSPQNWTAENHPFNTIHRSYTALPPAGFADYPVDLDELSVSEPQKAQQPVQELRRQTANPVEA
jgi:amidase